MALFILRLTQRVGTLLSKINKSSYILILVFLIGSVINLGYYQTLKSNPYNELEHISREISGSDDPVTSALRIITLKGVPIFIYSISEDRDVVNINDYEGREIPSIPSIYPDKPVIYSFADSKYLVSFIKSKSNSVMLLYDFAAFSSTKVIVIEFALILILFFTYLFVSNRDRARRGLLDNKRIIGEQKIQNALSHELKTPLSAIIGYHDLLDSSKSLEQAKIYNKKAQANAIRLANSIDQILSFSQSRERGSLGRESGSVKKLLTDLMLNYPNHKEQSMHLESASDRSYNNLWALELIMSNIISNYIKHSPRGSELYVRTIIVGGKFQIEVKQSKNVLSKKGHGLGLEIIDYLSARFGITVERDMNYNYLITI